MDGSANIRLHLFGTGDAFGNGGRYQTCFWLEGAGESLLIDCGATSLTALKAAGVEPNDIGSIVLTHLHGDHFGGLPFFVLDGQFRRRRRSLTVAGPPGTRERVEESMEVLFPGSSTPRRRFALEFVDMHPCESVSVGPATVITAPVEQPDTPACAVRIEYGGRVVTYSGDTAWSDDLIDLAAEASVFVAEAYFFDRPVPYHLDYGTLLAHHPRLSCDRIILTHMSPDMLAREGEAQFECAHDGMVLTV